MLTPFPPLTPAFAARDKIGRMVKEFFQSSQSVEWATPQDFFDHLDHVFDFQLDVCATRENRKCPRYFTKKHDGLEQSWHAYRRVWMNPPYGTSISKWMKKAYEESKKGCLVVALVPARVDTNWWKDWVSHKAHTEFIKGRLRFLPKGKSDYKHCAPFPSALVFYGLLGDRYL